MSEGMGLCRRISFQHSGYRRRSMIGLVEPPRMVTKGNKIFAETAGIREVEESRAKDRRALIYLPQRGIEAVWRVVRDTGFEPVTPTVSR